MRISYFELLRRIKYNEQTYLPINILIWTNEIGYQVRINWVFRIERHLHNNSVNGRIGVELSNLYMEITNNIINFTSLFYSQTLNSL